MLESAKLLRRPFPMSPVRLALLLLLLAGCSPADPTTSRPSAKAPAGDPWPECALVRAWLKDNLPDPSSLEIVRWEGRDEAPRNDPPLVGITVRFRARNAVGALALQVERFNFGLRDHRLISHGPTVGN
jgi:hypothetical protein